MFQPFLGYHHAQHTSFSNDLVLCVYLMMAQKRPKRGININT